MCKLLRSGFTGHTRAQATLQALGFATGQRVWSAIKYEHGSACIVPGSPGAVVGPGSHEGQFRMQVQFESGLLLNCLPEHVRSQAQQTAVRSPPRPPPLNRCVDSKRLAQSWPGDKPTQPPSLRGPPLPHTRAAAAWPLTRPNAAPPCAGGEAGARPRQRHGQPTGTALPC